MKPFSDNIIFMDTEFTDLDIRKGQLLSIGLVKITGEELYLEFEYTDTPHEWVVKNVLPYLNGEQANYGVAQSKIREFIGEWGTEGSKPYLVAYVNQFDSVFWYDLFGSAKDHPAYWIPIDFASILFGFGYAPDSMGHHRFFNELDIDKKKYNAHNALDDARLLRDVYKKFFEKTTPTT